MTRPVLTPCEPWTGAIAAVPRYAGKSDDLVALAEWAYRTQHALTVRGLADAVVAPIAATTIATAAAVKTLSAPAHRGRPL